MEKAQGLNEISTERSKSLKDNGLEFITKDELEKLCEPFALPENYMELEKICL